MQTSETLGQYDAVWRTCRELFHKKTQDYGTSWRILRLPSLTDQIFIKARRIRSVQEKGQTRVDEPVENAFMAIINYGVIALIQSRMANHADLELTLDEALERYDTIRTEIRELFEDKNHDYGEVWRDMRVSSITDLILMKILRIKQIEDNNGQTAVSEGVDGNYMDIVNYAIFALILLGENETA